MGNKYELIPSDREGLYRVKALRDFNDVKKGDIGGYVEGEKTLSQLGDCWIYDNAIVSDNAQVCNNARVYDNAIVSDNAQVCNNARVYDNAKVYGNAEIGGKARVCDDAHVYDNAKVCGDAVVCCKARVEDNAVVWNNAQIYGNAYLHDNAKVCGDAQVYGDTEVNGNAEVSGNAQIWGNAIIGGDAIISSDKDYIVFKNWWSSGRYFTWTRSNNMWKVGCFYGTGEELIAKAYKDSVEKGFEYKKIVDYVESILENQRSNYE